MSEPVESPTFVRLLNMLGAIRELSSFSELTADEELLLDDLVVRWHQSDSVTFSDIALDKERVSSSTLYRRLVALRDKGFISMRADEHDKRAKLLEPTPKARDYMKHLKNGLELLLRNEKTA